MTLLGGVGLTHTRGRLRHGAELSDVGGEASFILRTSAERKSAFIDIDFGYVERFADGGMPDFGGLVFRLGLGLSL